MRPAHLTRLLLLGIAAVAALRAQSVSRAADPRSADGPASWVVEGEWMKNPDEAAQSALEKARDRVAEYVHGQKPPFAWEPDADYVRDHLLKDLAKDDKVDAVQAANFFGHQALVEQKDFKDPQLGVMYKVRLKAAVGSSELREMRQKDQLAHDQQRQVRVHERQTWAGKVLLGLVVLLAGAAGYYRLDEATKGYYTGWLRLAVASLVGAVALYLYLSS